MHAAHDSVGSERIFGQFTCISHANVVVQAYMLALRGEGTLKPQAYHHETGLLHMQALMLTSCVLGRTYGCGAR